MSEISIIFTLTDDADAPIDADTTPRLRDEEQTFGIKREDNGAVIVAAGTLMIRDGVGTYHYTLADPIEGVRYLYSIELTASGETTWISGVKSATTAGSAAGLYADLEDVADLMGLDNLQIASDLENDDTAVDAARVQRGFNSTDPMIHAEIRGGGIFAVPLASMSTDTAAIMKDVSARLMAWWLYNNRGIADVDPQNPPKGVAGIFNNHYKIAMDTLTSIRFEPQRISATRIASTTLTKLSIQSSTPPVRYPITPLGWPGT